MGACTSMILLFRPLLSKLEMLFKINLLLLCHEERAKTINAFIKHVISSKKTVVDLQSVCF